MLSFNEDMEAVLSGCIMTVRVISFNWLATNILTAAADLTRVTGV